MASSAEFANAPGMTKEMRESVVAAFDALSNWRDEVETANERCLSKVLESHIRSCTLDGVAGPSHKSDAGAL